MEAKNLRSGQTDARRERKKLFEGYENSCEHHFSKINWRNQAYEMKKKKNTNIS